ncbi:hypothetical protein HCU66_14050 [Pseudomonas frederiksbergensis]|uniref:hypothetical protein n=1 Tax=Pseudomonas frederiksbergensis TaxID=104087 RepID=UPI0019826413|nr:hypothetical protein [Pseudomonas frederiksbergensis]MBN3863356.1 hypothetical protein [Pseudomonas frederiksbergensis]
MPIPNGNFETGDFTGWTVQAFNTPATVVFFNGSYKARLVGGRSTGQLLFTRIKAKPGTFTLSFTAIAPQSIEHQGPPDPLTHAFVLFIVTGFDASGVPVQHDFSTAGITPSSNTITYSGELLPGVEEVEIRFSIPSDPFANKGPVYLDEVNFV